MNQEKQKAYFCIYCGRPVSEDEIICAVCWRQIGVENPKKVQLLSDEMLQLDSADKKIKVQKAEKPKAEPLAAEKPAAQNPVKPVPVQQKDVARKDSLPAEPAKASPALQSRRAVRTVPRQPKRETPKREEAVKEPPKASPQILPEPLKLPAQIAPQTQKQTMQILPKAVPAAEAQPAAPEKKAQPAAPEKKVQPAAPETEAQEAQPEKSVTSPQKAARRSFGKIFGLSAILILAVVLIAAGVFLLFNAAGEEYYSELRVYAPVSAENGFPQPNFREILKINDDFAAWIYCPNSGINYPVVQGSDNQYYRSHRFDGKISRNGTLYMDSDGHSDFIGSNNVIYGENSISGEMFADLTQYVHQSYYEAHPQMVIVTPVWNYTVPIWAAEICEKNDESWKHRLNEQSAKQAWLTRKQELSLISSDVIPAVADSVVTLTTPLRDGRRMVVYGILVQE